MFRAHHSLKVNAVTEDDKEAFQKAMSGAKPLKAEPRVPSENPKPKPRAKFSRADEQAALEESLAVRAKHCASAGNMSVVER
jgi:DNA-nicking Smr family endonuclease